jgi:hypothetical protein
MPPNGTYGIFALLKIKFCNVQIINDLQKIWSQKITLQRNLCSILAQWVKITTLPFLRIATAQTSTGSTKPIETIVQQNTRSHLVAALHHATRG